ncbi:39S ribosomal protein l49, mitochondrial [Plakobranchus ocellatus]|uniref:Large ribosomal subunit protein mL49 n=1 Tax=Plakobranchus ocellatus TaxID=259542 RepID=A0AAV3YHZ9_9GAST|nr:39S ribosomal protein l49, mitochondrial [Plakobranchus ocellatus]
MATLSATLLRTCSQCRSLLPKPFNSATPVFHAFYKSKKCFLRNNHTLSKISLCRLLCAKQQLISRHQSTSSSEGQDVDDLLKDFEISHEEFRFVEQVLPSPTVPDLIEPSEFPTPSGWFPPNESLQAQQKYFVRRTKNHMLPVYCQMKNTWYGTTHYVSIKKIEGDIWALEADLREHVLKTTGQKKVNTQVHEVGRFIRVRGQHRDLIAKFLLERGM